MLCRRKVISSVFLFYAWMREIYLGLGFPVVGEQKSELAAECKRKEDAASGRVERQNAAKA